MLTSLSAAEILEREFLEVRAKLLQIAAVLDRLDRGPGDIEDDPRREEIRDALAILVGDEPDRAERVQLLFSLDYDLDWQAKFAMVNQPGR